MNRQLGFFLFICLFAAFVFSSTLIVGGCGGGGGGGGGILPAPSSTPTPTRSGVALFANDTYVDYIPGNTGSEASNLEATLRAQGHTVTPFTGITAPEIAAAVSGKAVLAMPELESDDLNAAIDDAARGAIANFVNGGGTYLAFFGNLLPTSRQLDLLNAVFGFSMTPIDDTAPLSRNAAGTIGTPYENCGPPTLTSLSATYTVDTASLPAEAKVIYEDASNNAVVTLIPVGSGNIVMLGWDWYNARPTGSEEGGWWSVLYKAARLNEAMPDVAVIYSTTTQPWYDEVQAKIMATCQCNTVDLIDASGATPSFGSLQAYDSLLVSSQSSFDDAVALGDNVADYVDAGGGVVLSLFSFYGGDNTPAGRFLSDNYYAIPANSGEVHGTHETGDFGLGFTSHPILAGVAIFDGGTDGINGSYQPNTNLVETVFGATRMANWSDGVTPLVVTRDIGGARRADLGFWVPSSDSRADLWVVGTDGDKLMANALTWAASWPEPSYATYNSADTPVAIPDPGGTSSIITVSEGPTSISKVKVTLNITHTFDGDLDISLESPNGTPIELTTDNGGGGFDFTATVFDDAAATAIADLGSTFAPFTGSYIPEQPLASVIGEDANGNWTLWVADDVGGDAGTLESWNISIR